MHETVILRHLTLKIIQTSFWIVKITEIVLAIYFNFNLEVIILINMVIVKARINNIPTN